MAASALNTYVLNRIDPAIDCKFAEIAVPFAPSQTIAAGTAVGMITASKLYKTYNNANSDGSETAVAILRYSIVVDASGNITLHGEMGETAKTADVIISGMVKESETTGLDANAKADLMGRTVDGIFIF